MDRSTWLKEKQRLSLERMDNQWSPIYDENWGTIDATHQQMFNRFLEACEEHSQILDAACGTGKFWPMLLAGGHTVFGIDQSQGMLNQAQAKFPDVPTAKVSLLEMD